jgi:hypothetical protein
VSRIVKSRRSSFLFAVSLVGAVWAAQACSDPATTTPKASGGSAGGGSGTAGSSGASGQSGQAGASSGGVSGASGAAGFGGAAGSGAGGLGGTAGSGGGSAGAAGGTTLEPTFLGVASIMRNNCGLPACHGGGPDGQDLIFIDSTTLYDILMTKVVMACNNSVLVVPNNPDNSALLKLPTWQCTDFVMPQGCIDDPCITQAELDTIRAWIVAGAPR